MPEAIDATMWRRSTYCADKSCVEVRLAGSEVLLRDSKDPDLPALHFGAAAWREFVDGIKNGEFESL